MLMLLLSPKKIALYTFAPSTQKQIYRHKRSISIITVPVKPFVHFCVAVSFFVCPTKHKNRLTAM